MRITNRYNLPNAIVKANSDVREPSADGWSVTEILKPVREIILTHRHWGEMEKDVSDMAATTFGSAVHRIFEDANEGGEAELELEWQITPKHKLKGRCDLYDEETESLEDYKTCSVTKIIKKDFEEWRLQGLQYAWLLWKQKGKMVRHLRFHALMKDWSKSGLKLAEVKGQWYPEHPIWTWEYGVSDSDFDYIEGFIKDKFAALEEAEGLSDAELPMCSAEERWNSGDKWAAYKKKGDKRAAKVCSSKEEAEGYGEYVELRPGEDKKCGYYCDVCGYCARKEGSDGED